MISTTVTEFVVSSQLELSQYDQYYTSWDLLLWGSFSCYSMTSTTVTGLVVFSHVELLQYD